MVMVLVIFFFKHPLNNPKVEEGKLQEIPGSEKLKLRK